MKAGGWHKNGGDISQELHGFSAGRQSNLSLGLDHQPKESPMKLPPKKQPKPIPLAERPSHDDQRLRATLAGELPMLARKAGGGKAESRRLVATLVEWPKR